MHSIPVNAVFAFSFFDINTVKEYFRIQYVSSIVLRFNIQQINKFMGKRTSFTHVTAFSLM